MQPQLVIWKRFISLPSVCKYNTLRNCKWSECSVSVDPCKLTSACEGQDDHGLHTLGFSAHAIMRLAGADPPDLITACCFDDVRLLAFYKKKAAVGLQQYSRANWWVPPLYKQGTKGLLAFPDCWAVIFDAWEKFGGGELTPRSLPTREPSC